MPSSIKKFFRRKKRTKRTDIFLEDNAVRLVHSGKEFFTCLKELIDGAESSFHLQTYILGDDETGRFIADALSQAVKRKVAVYVLVDGFASQISKEFRAEMEDAGIQFRFFEPLLRSRHFYFGRRLHHKVALADGARALVGSMNIADRYNDLPESRAWLDMGMYIEGDVCVVLEGICWDLWGRKRSRSITVPEKSKTKKSSGTQNVPVRIRRNDWVRRKQEIYGTYGTLFRLAEKNISIVCSYFLPGRLFRRLLKRAAKRGVEVKVVLAKKTDVKTAKYAERYLYRWLMRNKIKVYEYKPTVLHAKFAVVDKHYVTLGSYNLNDLSAYASIELNVDVKDDEFAGKVHKEVDKIIQNDCEEMNFEEFNTRLFSLRQFLQWSSFVVLRFMLTISTFYYRQRE